MRHLPLLAVSLLTLLLLFPAPSPAAEPVIGGPCEGCEHVFNGLPAELGAQGRIAPAAESGAPLIVEGTVRTLAGEPAAGIVVYAYQTDQSGLYPTSTIRHGRLRGWVRTGPDGKYRFDTIRPGAYPSNTIPEHIHMHVIEPGKATYYIDDIHFDDDPLLVGTHRQRAESGRRGGKGLVKPTKDAQGAWRVQRDITLGLDVPGYPKC
jgi:protocatechuate 3,4-dioxygenase beta subunit